MIVFLNGRFVPEDEALVSVFDRSFLYGDGLFETMRIVNGKPFRWDQHLERLRGGAALLKIKLPFESDVLRDFAFQLIATNALRDGLLRLTLSRGIGKRGYSPAGADQPSLVMSLHPASPVDPQNQPSWRLLTSSFRLPASEALARYKTCNKLPQIMARAEAEAAGADEALLLNTDGWVVEGSSSNLFWIEGQTILTPPLASGILAGVTRAVVLEICQKRGYTLGERNILPEDLRRSDGAFVSLSSVGVAEAESIDGQKLPKSPLIKSLASDYWQLVDGETR